MYSSYLFLKSLLHSNPRNFFTTLYYILALGGCVNDDQTLQQMDSVPASRVYVWSWSFLVCRLQRSKSEVEIENRRNKSQVKQLAYFTGADEAGNGKEDHRGPRLSVEPEHELIDSNVSLRVPSPSDLGTTEVALLPSR